MSFEFLFLRMKFAKTTMNIFFTLSVILVLVTLVSHSTDAVCSRDDPKSGKSRVFKKLKLSNEKLMKVSVVMFCPKTNC